MLPCDGTDAVSKDVLPELPLHSISSGMPELSMNILYSFGHLYRQVSNMSAETCMQR